MNDFDNHQARQEVQKLHQQATEVQNEGQFATMERQLEQAVSVAELLGDLPLLIKERFWLASVQQMQSKYLQAFNTYSQLIGLATDPELLTDSDTLRFLANAFIRFVDCGRLMPETSVKELFRVVADGLDWLERVSKANWKAGLLLEKGNLLEAQGDWKGALRELEVALALKRQDPQAPGYPLATHQLELADLLLEAPFKEYARAIALAEEVLSAPTSQYDRWWAYKTLAYTYLEMREHEAASSAAQESLRLAQAMETPISVTLAYELLGRIYRETGHLDQAAQVAAQQWHWARRDRTVEYRSLALANCARVRNLQARVACGLPVTGASFLERVPAKAQVARALRRVQSACRFVRWATPLAAQLNRQSGSRSYQEELDRELQAASKLEACLTSLSLPITHGICRRGKRM